MPLLHPALGRMAEEDPRWRRAYERMWWAELWLVLPLVLGSLALAGWAAWRAL